jgi:hypothetical protein
MSRFDFGRFMPALFAALGMSLSVSGVVHANAITVPLDLSTTSILNGNAWVTSGIDITGAGPVASPKFRYQPLG